MLEKHHQSIAPLKVFWRRLGLSILLALLLIIIGEGIGMIGYHYFEKMSWVDAFANAAMILSGMGPLTPLVTNGGKIFAGLYALFSGLAFIAIIGIIIVPIGHRYLHKFHMEDE